MLNRLKISLVLAPLALTILIGVYIYTLWSTEKERSAEIPFDSSGAMNRDLLKFYQKRGSFPEKLNDLEGVVWEKKDRNYVSGGRSMFHRNYFYMYKRVGPHQFTLWAIPVGRYRDDAPTFHLVGTPGSHRLWKGPALPIPDVENLSFTPSLHKLHILGLVEQLSIPTPLRSNIPFRR